MVNLNIYVILINLCSIRYTAVPTLSFTYVTINHNVATFLERSPSGFRLLIPRIKFSASHRRTSAWHSGGQSTAG